MEEQLESTPVETAEVESAPAEIAEPEATKLDWWNPESWGETPAKDVVSKIQTKYNENATKVKTLENDYQSTQQEMEKIVTDVKRALSDRTYYEAQRRQLGYTDEPEVKAPELDFSKLETVGDLQNALTSLKTNFEKRLEQAERQAEVRAESRIKQAVDPISKERWSVAIEGMKSKYGDKWSSSERKVVAAITNGSYAYKPGTEKELLDKVFRAECPQEYEAIVMENLKKRASEKKGATTVTPRASAPKSKPGGSTSDDIIARVQARLGANTLRK